ncbi:hypothetical protein DT603_01530 [Pseudoxanthomonas gei]|uniref:Uncharacterized protein n=1 Tax=Pseudoxanthomonas gei TaxID=1383030 RepID=A0ABX0A7P4_9GAMM|nr:hypothetical protein [Pseudoxanthomonas gei]
MQPYLQQGAYVDCYSTQLPGLVTQTRFVEAFYMTRLFKLERAILAWVVKRPSTDAQATQLAHGSTDSFAAWNVERQSENQVLLCDLHGRTRSWLMAVAEEAGGTACTRLYFGSAVVPAASGRSGRKRMGTSFRLLLGFHRIYSRALLGAARARLLSDAA